MDLSSSHLSHGGRDSEAQDEDEGEQQAALGCMGSLPMTPSIKDLLPKVRKRKAPRLGLSRLGVLPNAPTSCELKMCGWVFNNALFLRLRCST